MYWKSEKIDMQADSDLEASEEDSEEDSWVVEVDSWHQEDSEVDSQVVSVEEVEVDLVDLKDSTVVDLEVVDSTEVDLVVMLVIRVCTLLEAEHSLMICMPIIMDLLVVVLPMVLELEVE